MGSCGDGLTLMTNNALSPLLRTNRLLADNVVALLPNERTASIEIFGSRGMTAVAGRRPTLVTFI